MRTHLLVTTAATVAAGLLASQAMAADSVSREQVTPPKLTRYTALLDVAGFVTVRQLRDSTQECAPGRDMVIEYEGHAETGRPRPVTVSVINGVTTSSFAANAGGAASRARISSYSETNWCPPVEPSQPIGKPACRARVAGALRAHLTPTPEASDDLTPLSRGVSLALFRNGGPNQDLGCRDFKENLEPSVGPHVLNIFELGRIGMVLPLGVSDVRVRSLRRGQSIRRSITLNGACDHVLVRTSATSARGNERTTSHAFEENCTVTGRFYVHLRRTR